MKKNYKLQTKKPHYESKRKGCELCNSKPSAENFVFKRGPQRENKERHEN